MNKSKVILALAVVVLCGLSSISNATLIPAEVEWGTKLDDGDSLTCIAHYIPSGIGNVSDSLIFTAAPVFTGTYTGGDQTGWQTAISG